MADGWAGQTGVSGRFATFDSPDAGYDAALNNLRAYVTKHGLRNLNQIFQRWDPTSHGYGELVGKLSGIDPNSDIGQRILTDTPFAMSVLRAAAKIEKANPSNNNPLNLEPIGGGPAGAQAMPPGLDMANMPAIIQQLLAGVDAGPDMANMRALQGRTQAANAEEAKALDQYGGDLADIRKRRQGIVDPDAPTPPKLPGEQEYQDKELRQVSNHPMEPMRAMGQFLPMLAILGGAFTKGNAIGSLKAAGAAMNAARQNDKDAIERAHQNWMDETKKLMDQYQLEQGQFQDAITKNGDKRADLVADMNVLAAQYNIPAMKAALAAGDLDNAMKIFQARNSALTPMLSVWNNAVQQDLERQRLQEEQRYHDYQMQHGTDMVPPATQEFNDARSGWLRDHPGDVEGADKAANDAFRRAELAAHPTAAGAMGLQEERNLESDPVIKAFRTNSQYITSIESLTDQDLQTGPGQVRLLDNFTRLITNQAIRQFMVSSAEKYQGVVPHLQVLIEQNTGKTAPFLTPQQVAEYRRQAGEIVTEIGKTYGRQLAQHAENMEGRGIDPTTGGLTGADLELAEQNGYRPDPSKWTLSNADQGQTQTQTAGLPNDLPSPAGVAEGSQIKDGSGKVIAVLRGGQWVSP